MQEIQLRKTKSHFGQVLQNVLLTEQPWLQAEKLPGFLKFFIKEELLGQFRNNTNHIICGRRGTGKTHILGALYEQISNDFTKKEIAVFISCQRISITPPSLLDESEDFSCAKNSRIMFKNFLNEFMNDFISKTDDYIKTRLKKVKNETELNRIKVQTDNYLFEILKLIEFGTINHNNNHKEASSRKNKRNQSQNVSSYNLSIDLNGIRNNVIAVLDLLEIDILYILIDEWMELDKNLNLRIQPYFAQLLKLAFFNHKKFSVKIASVWHNTKLYDADLLEKSRGIELGEDISLGIDLDTEFFDNEKDVVAFFRKMLFVRLCYLLPDLKVLSENGDAKDFFIEELFDNYENFKTLIIASHGIPRDFWEIFQKCSLKINRDFQNYCINRNLIQDIARDIYLLEIRKRIDKESDSQKLWEKINVYIDKTEMRYFLVENTYAKTSIVLRKLIDEEFIHPIPSALTPRIIRDRFKMYNLNYGDYIDWCKSKKTKTDHLFDENIFPKIPVDFESSFEKYIISINEFTHEYITCPWCKYVFINTEPIYLKYKSCPKCANEIPNKNNGGDRFF